MDHKLLLESFCSKDTTRTNLTHPFSFNDMTGATDGHVLILIKGLPKEYEDTDLKIDTVLPPDNQEVLIDVEKFKKIIEQVPLVDEMIEEQNVCSECDGDGTIECDKCGSEVECEECEGTGYVMEKTKETGNKVPDRDCKIEIDGVIFHCYVIEKLILVLNEIEIKSFKWISKEPFRANKFEIDNIIVLLMPVRADEINLKINIETIKG